MHTALALAEWITAAPGALRPAQRIRPAVGRKVLALLPAALKRRCRAMALDIDAVLDAEYVLITERCRTEGLICAVRKLTQYDLPRLPGVGGGDHDAQPFVRREARHQNWPPHFAFWRPHDEYRLLAGRGSIDPSLATPFKPEGAVNRERDIEDAEPSKSRRGALSGFVRIGTSRSSNHQSSHKNEEKFLHLIDWSTDTPAQYRPEPPQDFRKPSE